MARPVQLEDALAGSGRKSRLKRAKAHLEAGNPAQAEVLCRAVLARAPRDAGALNMIGMVAWQIGLPRAASDYFRRAVDAAPEAVLYRRNLAQAERVLAARKRAPGDQPPAGPRTLLIKAWGYGFWSDIDHVLGQLLLAEITGRVPVVHWGTNSLFRRGAADDNAFTNYFEPISTLSIDDLSGPEFSYFPAKWRADNLREEDLEKWQGPHSRMAALALSRARRDRGGQRLPHRRGRSGALDRARPSAPRPRGRGCLSRTGAPPSAPGRGGGARGRGLPRTGAGRRVMPGRAHPRLRQDHRTGRAHPPQRALSRRDRPRPGRAGWSSPASDRRPGRPVAPRGPLWRAAGEHRLPAYERYDRHPLSARRGPLPAWPRGHGRHLSRGRADRFLGNGMCNLSSMVRYLKDWPAGAYQLLVPSLHLRVNEKLHER